ncbi:RNU1 [Symbiodinium sp. CCMP2456]|nr:RNU1 [Symbiodinium sp. CCMP2456]
MADNYGKGKRSRKGGKKGEDYDSGYGKGYGAPRNNGNMGGQSAGGKPAKDATQVHHYPPKEMAADVGYPVRGGQTLLIAYFPWEASEADIEREFSKFCRVKRVHLVVDKSSRKPRCFGFVKFLSKADAEEALRATTQGLVQLPDTRGHVWHLKAEWTKSGDMVVDDSEAEQEVAKRKEERRSRTDTATPGAAPPRTNSGKGSAPPPKGALHPGVPAPLPPLQTRYPPQAAIGMPPPPPAALHCRAAQPEVLGNLEGMSADSGLALPRPAGSMEAPRISLGGLAEAPRGAVTEPEKARVARRPEHHRMATPRTSLGSAASSPRRGRRLLQRPENHAMETPRTSIGSGRLSLASLREVNQKCTRRQKLACGLVTLMLLAVVGGVLAFVLLRKDSVGPAAGIPQGNCSAVQIEQGCAPGFCAGGQCSCAPNYDQMDKSHCAVPLANKRMQFFVYKVVEDSANADGCSADFAQAYSLQGVLWYIHNAVVNQSCPRSGNLSRILRCRATVFNTEQPFLEWKGQFGPFTTFDSAGSCTSPDCLQTWRKFGRVVGCLPWSGYMGGYSYGNSTHLYSFPDEGKSVPWSCAEPDGSKNCTWKMEEAGEVRLDDLENISDYKAFCTKGGAEYVKSKDTGRGCSFWDHQNSGMANTHRVARLQQLFEASEHREQQQRSLAHSHAVPPLQQPLPHQGQLYGQHMYGSQGQQLYGNQASIYGGGVPVAPLGRDPAVGGALDATAAPPLLRDINSYAHASAAAQQAAYPGSSYAAAVAAAAAHAPGYPPAQSQSYVGQPYAGSQQPYVSQQAYAGTGQYSAAGQQAAYAAGQQAYQTAAATASSAVYPSAGGAYPPQAQSGYGAPPGYGAAAQYGQQPASYTANPATAYAAAGYGLGQSPYNYLQQPAAGSGVVAYGSYQGAQSQVAQAQPQPQAQLQPYTQPQADPTVATGSLGRGPATADQQSQQQYLDMVWQLSDMSLNDKQALPAPPAQQPPAPPAEHVPTANWQRDGTVPAAGSSAAVWNSFDDAAAKGMVDGLVGGDETSAPPPLPPPPPNANTAMWGSH